MPRPRRRLALIAALGLVAQELLAGLPTAAAAPKHHKKHVRAHAATRDLDLSGGAETIQAVVDPASPPPLQGELTCYFSPGDARVMGLRTGLTRACAARGAPRRIALGTGTLVGLRVGVDTTSDPPGVTSLEFTIDDGDGAPPRVEVCGGTRAARGETAGGVTVALPVGAAVAAIGGACAGSDDLRLDATTVDVVATYGPANPGGPDPPAIELKRRTVRGVPVEYAALILPPPIGDGVGGGSGDGWVADDAAAEGGGFDDAVADDAVATPDDDWAYGPDAEAAEGGDGGGGGEDGGRGDAATPPAAAPSPSPSADDGDLWPWDPPPPAPPKKNRTAAAAKKKAAASAAKNATAATTAPLKKNATVRAAEAAAGRAARAEAAALANATAGAHGGDPGLWLDWPMSGGNGTAGGEGRGGGGGEEEEPPPPPRPPADPTLGAAAVVTATDPTGFTLLTMILDEAQTTVKLRWTVGSGAGARTVEEAMPVPGPDGGGAAGAAGGAEASSAAAPPPPPPPPSPSTPASKKAARALVRARRVTAWGLVRVADFVVASVLAGAEEEAGGGEAATTPAPAPAPAPLAEEGGGRPKKLKPSPRPPPPNVLYEPPTTPVKAYRDPGAAAARAFAAARVLLPPQGGGGGGHGAHPPAAAVNASTAATDAAVVAHVATVPGRRRRRSLAGVAPTVATDGVAPPARPPPTRGRRRLADAPGCDGFPDTTCTLACCARHDECYFRHGCTAASWAPTLRRAVGLEGALPGLGPSPASAALFLGSLGGKVAAAAAGDAPAGVPGSDASEVDVCVECNTNAVACLLAACGPLSGGGGGGKSGPGGERGDVCYDSDKGLGCSKFFTCPAAYDANGTALVDDRTADDGDAGLGVDGLAAAARVAAAAAGVRGGGLGAAAMGVAPRPSSAADRRRAGGRADTCECPPTPADDHTGPCPTAENPCCAHAALIPGAAGCPGETGGACPTPDAPYPCCCCPVGQVCGAVAADPASKNGKKGGGIIHTCVPAPA